jgi:hypothetical protein
MIVNCPVNTLSFGQVSVNILEQMFLANMKIGFFPIGETDLTAYDVSDDFKNWLNEAYAKRYEFLERDEPTLKIWHLNGTEAKLTSRQALLTFHETSLMTDVESYIASKQDKVFVCSEYTWNVFSAGKHKLDMAYIKLGIDNHLFKKDMFAAGKRNREVTQWGLVGKYEARKNTKGIIEAWTKLFGNNPKHQLNLLVYNPFFSNEQNTQLLLNCFKNREIPSNVNPLSPVSKNRDMFELYNYIDIDLGGLSFGEGLNIPSLTAYSLGKHCVVLKGHAHDSWTGEDCTFVIPEGQVECYDSVFFHKDLQFNQGNFNYCTQDSVEKALGAASINYQTPSFDLLRETVNSFSYSGCVNSIMSSFS